MGRRARRATLVTVSGAYLGPAEIRDLAQLLDLQPTKKLGQNFVVDANTVRRIVAIAGVGQGDTVLEVGPGLGSLTLGLLSAGASVVAVEIDRRLADQLPKTVRVLLPNAQLQVVCADAMAITELPAVSNRLVANLPYNISVPVLLHVLQHFPSLQTGLVMVQAEVGQRIAALPGSRVYGGPSAKAAWYGQWRRAGQVSRQVFWPVPNIDSILIGFERRSTPVGSDAERRETFAIIDAAFGQRRKMLRQSLLGIFGADAVSVLERAGVDPTRRAEELSLSDFLCIARVDRSA